MTKTYKQLQDEAELLGIRQNQSTDDMVKAIGAATSPKAVAALMELNEKLGEAAEAAKESGAVPTDIQELLQPAITLYETQLAGKEVYTDPYQTGLANGMLLTMGAIRREDVPEDELLKPVTASAISGKKPLTGRQQLIRAATKFITLKGNRPNLRSGLTPEDIEKADEIMKALGVEKGQYEIPAE